MGGAENPDVRWKQRFHNFRKAAGQLRAAVSLARQRELSQLERQGVIKAFEFTHELAWNTLKDYLEDQGETALSGSKDVTRRAFRMELMDDGDIWMDMIQSRNRSVHSYEEVMAAEISARVIESYFPAFERFETTFLSREHETT